MNNPLQSIYIYPTDTVWGIGARISDKDAHRQINLIKKIDSLKPLSVLFTSFELLLQKTTLPPRMTDEWLRHFFSQESTIIMPNSWMMFDIPPWISPDGKTTGIRCLDLPLLSQLTNSLPITTTSLNLTGNPPITSLEEASRFRSKHVPDAIFVNIPGLVPSGKASTIVSVDDDGNYAFIRRGRFENDIEKHLRLLTA